MDLNTVDQCMCQECNGMFDCTSEVAPVAVQTMKPFFDKIKAESVFYEYPGQNHGFMNSGNKEIKDKMASMPPQCYLVVVLTLDEPHVCANGHREDLPLQITAFWHKNCMTRTTAAHIRLSAQEQIHVRLGTTVLLCRHQILQIEQSLPRHTLCLQLGLFWSCVVLTRSMFVQLQSYPPAARMRRSRPGGVL